uniref:BTB domain-containing protein n=1 Tax=Mycena chlorophos TaxID=658473 RepID=A0ABQ0LRP6_MYCCL|nr:predicted protein [Mycena chlorophos]
MATAKETYHPSFDDEFADVVLQSLEGTLYRVHSFVLRTTSGFFRTMLSLPQPPAPDGKPHHAEIPVGEHDVVLERVLRMLCGLEIPRWTSFDELESALELIEKWDTPGPLSFIRTALPAPMFADDPLRVYLLATRFGWQEETDSALVQTLKLDLLAPAGELEEMLCRLSSRSLLKLVTFHERCKTRFRTALDGTELFAAGNEEQRECSCGKRRDNYTWRMLKAKIISEFNRRPLGDRILVDMAGWPEAAACWRAKCMCGNMNYDQAGARWEPKNERTAGPLDPARKIRNHSSLQAISSSNWKMSMFTWTPFPYAYFTLYLACIFTPLVIAGGAGRLTRALFFVPILLLSAQLLYEGEAGYLTCTAWFACLPLASDLLLLSDAYREFYRVDASATATSPARRSRSRRSPPPNANANDIRTKPLLERVEWAVGLFCTVGRGIGWAHGHRGQARHASQTPDSEPSRPRFVLSQLPRLLFLILLFDLTNIHARWNPVFCARLGLTSVGLGWRVLGTLGWATGAMAGMSAEHVLLSIVFVGSGYSRPRDWPPLFGGFEDVTSVRGFWSRGWHQMLRRPLSAHARFLTGTILRLPPRSLTSICISMQTVFFLSGLVHYLGEQVALSRIGFSSGSLVFFSIQPLAIALETLAGLFFRDHVHFTVEAKRVLGMSWTLAWFVLTFPLMLDPLLRSGEMDPRITFSPITWVVRGHGTLRHADFCAVEYGL